MSFAIHTEAFKTIIC